jgi:hypothetical protein
MLATAIATAATVTAAAVSLSTAIVTQDQASLRASPRDSARQQAVLWAGEEVEIRGEKMDYVQVWDHKRERGGFVRASELRRLRLDAADAPELLTLLRFVRDTPGSEALGIGIAAAYMQAAPAEVLNGDAGIEALDALGTVADRLAQLASTGSAQSKSAAATLSAHLDVARGYGVNFAVREREGRMQICYDGDAFRRVLAMRSNPEQRARAALALTRSECVDPDLKPMQRKATDEWRAEVLDRVDAATLPGYLKNRILMRRAAVWSSLAYERVRSGGNAGSGDKTAAAAVTADAAASRALAELAGIVKTDLTDDDASAYNDAAIRVNASRWAAAPVIAAKPARAVSIITTAAQSGETCIALVDAKHDIKNPLIARCTYGLVWEDSATFNREGTAMALAVQPMDAWREMWIFRKLAGGWTVSVVPPASVNPGIGYAEFAGWVPGGKQMLVAREAKGDGKYQRNFELVRLDTLATQGQARNPDALGMFKRWQDPAWKRLTVSVR